MKLKFLGAAGTVTGSSYVLTSGSGHSILIDLGMFQGLPEIEQLNYQPYNFDCSTLFGAVLTHAHQDHCGRLPILLSRRFRGNIYMTPPTAELTEISLLDSAKIAATLRDDVLYDKHLAEKTIRQFKLVNYRTPLHIGDFSIVFRDAGHILGSASLEISDAHPDSPIKKIIFSGDLGNSPEDLVMETELLDDADAVVMESTYGDRLHPKEVPSDIIESEIKAVEESGGTLLIPAFAVERTQELLHTIMHLKQEGKIQSATPIFMDSPMANRVTEIYTLYPEAFNAHIQDDLKIGNPFECNSLEVIGKRSQSEAIYERKGAKVIIAGGGMMTGGRILSHAANYLPLASTRLLIVGFQGEGTLGRELKKGARDIVIDGKSIAVKAVVNSTDSMSSHADQEQLMSWLSHIKGVKKIFLTHGEDHSRLDLSIKIKNELDITDLTMPSLNQEFGI